MLTRRARGRGGVGAKGFGIDEARRGGGGGTNEPLIPLTRRTGGGGVALMGRTEGGGVGTNEAHGHEATDTGLAYAPVSQAHGHHHTQFNVLPCCTAAQ